MVLAADDPLRVKLFKFPPSADNDLGVGLSKRVDNRLAKGGRPKHTNIPALQNLAPDVRGNGMYASWKLPYMSEGSRYEED